MGIDLAGKRVLVLSDNDGLSGAIELNLKRSHLEIIKLAPNLLGQRRPEPVEGRGPELASSQAYRGACPEPVLSEACPEPCRRVEEPSRRIERRGSQAQAGDFDLIVVAMSSSTNEPLAALARASLTGRIGQVPLLIISDRPLHSDPDEQITHLDFPFDVDGLHDKVKEILQRGRVHSNGGG